MAIFIPGMKCNICGKPVIEKSDVKLFPAFLSNEIDPLFVFNDAIIHKECFSAHPMAERVTEILNELVCKIGPAKRYCNICTTIIKNPDEYMNFSCLSSDVSNPLSKFNFTQYHKSCFRNSSIAERIDNMIYEQEKCGEWKGKKPF